MAQDVAETEPMPLEGFACPNPECDSFNRFGAGNLTVCDWMGKNEAIRRLYCSHCGHRFSEGRGSLMQDAKLPVAAVVRMVPFDFAQGECLTHGCSLEATADICDVDPRTVEKLLDRAGPRSEEFHRQALQRLETAAAMVAVIAACCLGTLPLLLVDGHLPYPAAILRGFGVIKHCRRKGGRGRPKRDRLKPPPGLLVGVVNKMADKSGRVFKVRRHALFGRLGLGTEVWAVPRYVTHPVHHDDLGRQIWAEEQAKLLTPAAPAKRPFQNRVVGRHAAMATLFLSSRSAQIMQHANSLNACQCSPVRSRQRSIRRNRAIHARVRSITYRRTPRPLPCGDPRLAISDAIRRRSTCCRWATAARAAGSATGRRSAGRTRCPRGTAGRPSAAARPWATPCAAAASGRSWTTTRRGRSR